MVQSGPLMSNFPGLEQICDYAVSANLSVIVYFARNGDANNVYRSFLDIAPSRWGSNFLGIYFNDEQGGKMIDAGLMLYDNSTGGTIASSPFGPASQGIPEQPGQPSYSYTFYPGDDAIMISRCQTYPDQSIITNETVYYQNGTITQSIWNMSAMGIGTSRTLRYQPNGVVEDSNGILVTDAGSISQVGTYDEAYNLRPLQTQKQAADLFVGGEQNILTWVRNISNVRLFTSDYALDWFDNQAGYDVVLAQLGWGQNATQNIARIRGAADIQGKNWGTMITWASTNAPYLMSGSQMFEEMRQSYRSGADYVVVFNYNQSYIGGVNGSYTGTDTALLHDEHFAALDKFWNEVVQNSSETNNAKGSVAFVLPQYYGSVMRFNDDSAWGLFSADNTTRAIYNNLQAALEKYGSQLDIVYDDPAYPLQGKYSTTIDAIG